MNEPRSGRAAGNGADVVIVGAGAAGCVIARRLLDAGATVLLLEAGGTNADERISDPRRSGELWGSVHDWALQTVPQRNLGGQVIEWAQGRVLGGSSSINTMVWIRGCPQDYDAWAYPGNPGWSFADLLPLFRRIEDFDLGSSEFRGAGGPMPVSTRYEKGDIHQAVLDGMRELGLPLNDDHNAGDTFGTGWCQFNIRAGRRVSAATAYLEPVITSPRLELVGSALATRLLLDGDRCVGVEWRSDDGALHIARAGSEVVVSAGAVGSPKLLLLSGIGPAAELAAAGVDAVVDLPGVGSNLQDHVHVPLIFATDRPIDPPVGVPPLQTNTFIRTDPALYCPDIQVPSIGFLGEYPGLEHDSEHGFMAPPTLLRTASRGRIRLAGPDPAAYPLIDPATYEGPGDLVSLVAGLSFLRGLAGTEALKEWGARELHPGPDIVEDRDLEAYARGVTKTASHPVGTCKMGVDADAVVDPRLRVYGVEGLRVADSSIMPTVVSGNTHAPTLAIGERASDLLLAGTATPASTVHQDTAPALQASSQ